MGWLTREKRMNRCRSTVNSWGGGGRGDAAKKKIPLLLLPVRTLAGGGGALAACFCSCASAKNATILDRGRNIQPPPLSRPLSAAPVIRARLSGLQGLFTWGGFFLSFFLFFFSSFYIDTYLDIISVCMCSTYISMRGEERKAGAARWWWSKRGPPFSVLTA